MDFQNPRHHAACFPDCWQRASAPYCYGHVVCQAVGRKGDQRRSRGWCRQGGHRHYASWSAYAGRTWHNLDGIDSDESGARMETAGGVVGMYRCCVPGKLPHLPSGLAWRTPVQSVGVEAGDSPYGPVARCGSSAVRSQWPRTKPSHEELMVPAKKHAYLRIHSEDFSMSCWLRTTRAGGESCFFYKGTVN